MSGKEKDEWQKAVDEEHQRMVDHEVFEVVTRKGIPKDAKVLTSTWAMKKKASGVHRA
jgi:hypothetical protein